MTRVAIIALFILLAGCKKNLPEINFSFEEASVFTSEQEITVSTGVVEGRWEWTGKGFVTTGFRNLVTGTEWVSKESACLADWDLGMPGMGNARLIALEATGSDDDGFTSGHISVTAIIEYPDALIELKYLIWAYPGAPGLRTQLLVKGKEGFSPDSSFNSHFAQTDHIPADVNGLMLQTVGYYNNHDGRNADTLGITDVFYYDTPASADSFPLANILFAYNEYEGFGLVKESQKVVNRESINTGIFYYNQEGVFSTGWGLSQENIVNDLYRPCWAVWRMVWKGDDDDKQLAVKQFDRLRYPVDPQYDVFLMTNVWGGGKGGASASEENILKEIRSSADLGIDVVQIDAGWGPDRNSDKSWEPSADAYPEGWSNIMNEAREKGVTMGVWNRAYDLIKHPDRLRGLYDAGFRYYKIDLDSWGRYNILDSIVFLARDLVKYSNHTARVNWDVTHTQIRVGYLFAREYGNLFLQNRRLAMEKDKIPTRSVYIPRRVLKDQWQVGQYLNLNEIMFNVQNTDLVLKEYSNAHLYGNVYSFAITMMSSPLFFQETWRYQPGVREPLRNLIGIYKKHRVEMSDGYVFPLGDKPDDAAWTGFQNFNPETGSGYITLFREINNTEEEKAVSLKFLKGKTLQFENLLTNEKQTVQTDERGTTIFKLDKPATFLFYRYESQ
jgi:hypothetical protein